METDAGRAVMETPTATATTFVLNGRNQSMQTLFPGLSTITSQLDT